MGLSELNFDFGFIGLFLFLGPPVILLLSIAWFIDEILFKIQSWRFKTDTHEGWVEETKYLNEKFEKKKQFEKQFPILTKSKKLLGFMCLLVVFLMVTFLWGWFILNILE